MRPARIIIGGGIGSGKSEVGRMLAERGFAVLDADRVGHDVLASGHPVAARVAIRWPEALVEGRIDRGRLGRIVFGDPLQLGKLEALTHPAIRRIIERWGSEVGDRPAAVEVPVLADLVDESWVRATVDTPTEARRERLRRRGMSDDDIDARMAIQPSREEWRSAADLVVDNGGTQESLVSEIDRLIRLLVVSGQWSVVSRRPGSVDRSGGPSGVVSEATRDRKQAPAGPSAMVGDVSGQRTVTSTVS